MVNSKIILPVLIGFIIFFSSYQTTYAQTIDVNQTTPCFLNYTAGYKVWDDCGMDEDWLQASLIGFEWVTGGYFSFILVGILVMFTYIKYHKAIYPLLIGVVFLPISYALVPSVFWTWLIVLVVAVIGITIYKTVKNQTNEFST